MTPKLRIQTISALEFNHFITSYLPSIGNTVSYINHFNYYWLTKCFATLYETIRRNKTFNELLEKNYLMCFYNKEDIEFLLFNAIRKSNQDEWPCLICYTIDEFNIYFINNNKLDYKHVDVKGKSSVRNIIDSITIDNRRLTILTIDHCFALPKALPSLSLNKQK